MKKTVILISVLVLVAAFFLLTKDSLFKTQSKTDQSLKNQTAIPTDALTLAQEITHGHGLAVALPDPDAQVSTSKVYIATHHGLLVLVNDKDLYHVGESKDDYMGFSPHPKDPKIFFSSGHPVSGGNIGFQKSEDGGVTWKKVSNGVNGPVDFHAMTVSNANPNLLFGWYAGDLQKSNDEGKTWEIVTSTDFPVVSLAADPKDENILYASSPQGLMVSSDQGKTWSKLLDGFVSVAAINPADSNQLISFSGIYKLAKSSDKGKTWEKINADFNGATPLFISFNPLNSNLLYLLTEKNTIYKSSDSALTWNKIR